MGSVRDWAASAGYAYHCAGDDELLGSLPSGFRAKLEGRWPMLADLGRLKLAQAALDSGAQRVLWLDADVLIHAPERMLLPSRLEHGYAFGRELWVDERGRCHHGVHNALCLFEAGNPILPFYIHACERLVERHVGGHWAPQLLGPKFLKMQHNLLGFELLEHVAMLSPEVLEQWVAGGGVLWEKQRRAMSLGVAAVNLCSSLVEDRLAERAVERLLCDGFS